MKKLLVGIVCALLAMNSFGALTIEGTNATLVTSSSAKLNSYVTDIGSGNPDVWFYYGTNNGGEVAGDWQSVTNIGTQVLGRVSVVVSLTNDTYYYFRAYGTNSTETAWGGVRTFSTLPETEGAEAVVEIGVAVSNATLVTHNSAQLNGRITSIGDTNPVCWFLWGTSSAGTNFSSWANSTNIGQQDAGAISASVSSLASNTLHYFTVYASNSTDTAWGSVNSFTTIDSPLTDLGGTISNALYLGGYHATQYVRWAEAPGGGDVLSAGDLTQFTGLGGTTGQVWVSDGDGTGHWDDQTGGGGEVSEADLIAATNALYWQASNGWAVADAAMVLSLSNALTSAWQADNAAVSNGVIAQLVSSNWVTESVTNGLASEAWVAAQGYGDLDEATADGLYDPLGAAAAASNGVIAELVSSNWISHASGAGLYASTNGGWVDISGMFAPVTEPLWLNWVATSTWVQAESDPVFLASDVAGVTAADIANWNEAHGWGDHDGLYDPLGASAGASNGVIAQLVSSNWIGHASGAELYASSNGTWVSILGLFATNSVADDTLYGMSNGNWVAITAGGGDGTGDVSKVYVDTQDAAVSNGVLTVVGSRGYVTNNQSGVTFGSLTGTTIRATGSYTGGFLIGTNAGGIFVPRYTAASYDFDLTSGLTASGSYTNLNLSSIVPSGTKAVTIRAYIKDNLSTSVFLIRRDSSAGVTGTLVYSSVVNTYMFVFAPVAVSSSNTVEYSITSGTDEAGVVITGWYL